MEKLKLPEQLLKRINWVSDQYCDIHQEMQLMEINGKVVCSRCELDKENERFKNQVNDQVKAAKAAEKYNTLFKRSVISDETILDARFISFKEHDQEEKTNKQLVLDAFNRLRDGEIFNLILQGKQGTGKTHLTYALLHALNEFGTHSCLFISIDEMLRMIRDSFNNRESKFTESYFVDLLSRVDFLALDDLGAETGAITTEKSASDFVQRVLYAVSSSRQKKATILTTNLSGEQLFQIYDKKLVSRLMKNREVVIFKDSKDKRISGLEF